MDVHAWVRGGGGGGGQYAGWCGAGILGGDGGGGGEERVVVTRKMGTPRWRLVMLSGQPKWEGRSRGRSRQFPRSDRQAQRNRRIHPVLERNGLGPRMHVQGSTVEGGERVGGLVIGGWVLITTTRRDVASPPKRALARRLPRRHPVRSEWTVQSLAVHGGYGSGCAHPSTQC